MSRIHEDLPSESFSVPSGIVTATVCARSGKLPIEGICSGTLRTEYFAEGTVPTASCDVHYAGQICQYCNLPAYEGCPFKQEGVLELTPVEDISLQSGSSGASGQPAPQTTQTVNEDGSVTPAPSAPTNMCPHSPEFFANPDWEAIVNGQRAEIEQRLAAQQAAAQQAAEEQQAQQQPEPEQPSTP